MDCWDRVWQLFVLSLTIMVQVPGVLMVYWLNALNVPVGMVVLVPGPIMVYEIGPPAVGWVTALIIFMVATLFVLQPSVKLSGLLRPKVG